jgi:hypothetical protein
MKAIPIPFSIFDFLVVQGHYDELFSLGEKQGCARPTRKAPSWFYRTTTQHNKFSNKILDSHTITLISIYINSYCNIPA